jgi:hypothetical protein
MKHTAYTRKRVRRLVKVNMRDAQRTSTRSEFRNPKQSQNSNLEWSKHRYGMKVGVEMLESDNTIRPLASSISNSTQHPLANVLNEINELNVSV